MASDSHLHYRWNKLSRRYTRYGDVSARNCCSAFGLSRIKIAVFWSFFDTTRVTVNSSSFLKPARCQCKCISLIVMFCWPWISVYFILIINQLDAQNLFYNKFVSCLYMFRKPRAHRKEVKIVLYSLWYHHTCRWPSPAQSSLNLYTGRPPIGVMIPETV